MVRVGAEGQEGELRPSSQLAAHLLLCSLVPNRPQSSTGPWPGVGDLCCNPIIIPLGTHMHTYVLTYMQINNHGSFVQYTQKQERNQSLLTKE